MSDFIVDSSLENDPFYVSDEDLDEFGLFIAQADGAPQDDFLFDDFEKSDEFKELYEQFNHDTTNFQTFESGDMLVVEQEFEANDLMNKDSNKNDVFNLNDENHEELKKYDIKNDDSQKQQNESQFNDVSSESVVEDFEKEKANANTCDLCIMNNKIPKCSENYNDEKVERPTEIVSISNESLHDKTSNDAKHPKAISQNQKGKKKNNKSKENENQKGKPQNANNSKRKQEIDQSIAKQKSNDSSSQEASAAIDLPKQTEAPPPSCSKASQKKANKKGKNKAQRDPQENISQSTSSKSSSYSTLPISTTLQSSTSTSADVVQTSSPPLKEEQHSGLSDKTEKPSSVPVISKKMSSKAMRARMKKEKEFLKVNEYVEKVKEENEKYEIERKLEEQKEERSQKIKEQKIDQNQPPRTFFGSVANVFSFATKWMGTSSKEEKNPKK
ncbi:uncharacterized protein MONOS_11576 [Monocercomonoides exilis]|uniref:uncharacterized protein n=1 Tax=Monocercomonoides exilis TaxID=2049356 RepID=UPI003559BA25|nr:hypothetical protein MONOS_11576 [Monocercomonoides exilis]|eukprot:MONOS_11576.1-p1 / transcript=MONOS_11576.1 / gene=MONOS_11576 / organism=Monocercomonoides_exilis_PA203 / gene_product=unspecified product / transcript_product=unspecified product / location=Mono_scaffold00588:15937-17401(-) / protein_length=443 / sequence_SO=supercontig / SO=protein_coding / is_pseudo=false